MIHDGMQYDPIQGQCHGGLKVAKMLSSMSVSAADMHVIKKIMVNDITRQHSAYCVIYKQLD